MKSKTSKRKMKLKKDIQTGRRRQWRKKRGRKAQEDNNAQFVRFLRHRLEAENGETKEETMRQEEKSADDPEKLNNSGIKYFGDKLLVSFNIYSNVTAKPSDIHDFSNQS